NRVFAFSVGGRRMVVDVVVQTRSADTDADIRLKSAAAVEVIEQIGHRRPSVDVAARVDRRSRLDLVEAVAEFTFQTEAVLERVAEAEMLRPVMLKRRRAELVIG